MKLLNTKLDQYHEGKNTVYRITCDVRDGDREFVWHSRSREPYENAVDMLIRQIFENAAIE
jgi:hypothetical protein